MHLAGLMDQQWVKALQKIAAIGFTWLIEHNSELGEYCAT